MVDETGRINGDSGSLVPEGFRGCGRLTLDVGGGVKVVKDTRVEEGDLVLSQIESVDSGTPIVLLTAVAGNGDITFTRTDDVSSADDAVITYLVVRQQK